MAGCGMVPAPGYFSTSVIAFLDCQAQTLGERGYAALAAPGSSVAGLLTVLLTIQVALIGYRLLMGEAPTLREGLMTFAKIGIVLAFATSWPAYRRVVYDVVLTAPANLAAEIGAPAEIPGAAAGMPGRLDGVDRGFRTLSLYGEGATIPDPSGRIRPQEIPPPMFGGSDLFALGFARLTFIVTSLGAFAFIRLAAGLLLALGPLFVAFLLFETTRGLFIGWVRALVGLTLAALSTTILLGIELALMEPWLSELLRERARGGSVAGTSILLLAITMIFALVAVALLWLTARLARTVDLSRAQVLAAIQPAQRPSEPGARRSEGLGAPTAPPERSRALTVADGVASVVRYEERTFGASLQGAVRAAAGDSAGYAGPTTAAGAGSASRGRTSSRVSKGARMRDRRS